MIALKAEGYTDDFNLHPESIESTTLKQRFSPEEFHVDHVYRFEGMTNPDDSAVLYAISSTAGAKGLLVDAYGAYAEALSPVMIKKLRVDADTNVTGERHRKSNVK